MRKIDFVVNHLDGFYCELVNDDNHNDTYTVKFIDQSNGGLLYQSEMKPKTWVRLSRKYLSDILVEVYLKEELVYDFRLYDYLKGKRIFISFESKSLGDTLAWIHYCEIFRTRHGCEVIVSTFMNDLFAERYPHIKFVGRGVVVHGIAAMFKLGWFYDKDKEPENPVTIPLQKTASNILGLEYTGEIIPRLSFKPSAKPVLTKYVCISTKSTSQMKEWYYWQELIDWLNESGYKVIEISKEETNFKNLLKIKEKSLLSVMNYIHHAEYFIGLSSGLSWLSWALKKPVVMIANFTNKEHEFSNKCIRVVNESVCNSCWNNPMFMFNKGDWNYCPEHEDTPMQFICHKSITAEMVINEIKAGLP